MPQMRSMLVLVQNTWDRSLRNSWIVTVTLTLGALMLCFTAVGCDNTRIIWSTEAHSGNGKWIATAQSVRHSGPGNKDVETKVYLTSLSTGKKVEVLGFAHDPTLISNTIDLKLTWQAPTRLQVTYTNHPKIYLQQTEVGEVMIAAEERSAAPVRQPAIPD